jgi:putative AdoMet-dependent methyltransferase
MRSRYADRFNHDPDAATYDLGVLDETDPIRCGYGVVLDWVAREARTDETSLVLDLGAGTGNLGLRLGEFRELYCVDVSGNMIRRGRKKLDHRPGVVWIQEDLLEFVHRSPLRFDVVVSTYAAHHLPENEKEVLFRKIWESLAGGGRAVFGDLMYADEKSRQIILEGFRGRRLHGLAEELEDEFPWYVDRASSILRGVGFEVKTRRFSELSWGISARRRPS